MLLELILDQGDEDEETNTDGPLDSLGRVLAMVELEEDQLALAVCPHL